MNKTSSPYINLLLNGEIKWLPYSTNNLRYASEQEKIIYLHIGSITEIKEREKSLDLFSDQRVISLINNNFIPIVIDIEDFPEIGQIGFNLLSITEKSVSLPINIFILPGLTTPFACFSSPTAEEFIMLANNTIEAFKNKRKLLEEAGAELLELLEKSGKVVEKEQPFEIKDKILHAYVRNWVNRSYLLNESKEGVSTIRLRYCIFLLKYAQTYKRESLLEVIKLHMIRFYHSAMFDPIEGGIFSQYSDNDYNKPLPEKLFIDNVLGAMLYSLGYRYFGEKLFKEASDSIVAFIERCFKWQEGAYMTSITLPKKNSTYYSLSLDTLKEHFGDEYLNIANNLSLDSSLPFSLPQFPKNSTSVSKLSDKHRDILLQIRKEREDELILDKRIIVACNALYASLLPLIAQRCNHQTELYVERGAQIIEFILSHLKDGKIKLHRYYLSPQSYGSATLLDYALFIMSLVIQVRISKDSTYNKIVTSYISYVLKNFYKPDNGMFAKSTEGNGFISVECEPTIDYRRFSANSIMAGNLLFLYKIFGKRRYLDLFKQQLYNVSPYLIGAGPYLTSWGLQILNYLQFLSEAPSQKTS